MKQLRRALWLLPLLGGLTALAPAAVLAQDMPVEGGEVSSGDPLYGYLATTALAGAVMFILCKSARRN
jgi:hypothetical protein